MNMIKRLMALLLAVLMCGAVAIAEPAADDVLATVGSSTVTRAEYESNLVSLQNYYAQYYDLTQEGIMPTLQLFAMQTAVEYAVMDEKLVELGMSLTETEAAAATDKAKVDWEAVIQDGLSYYGITAESTEEERAETLISVLAELEAQGYTEEGYISDMLLYAGYDKLQAMVTDDVTVTDEEVTEHYNFLVESDKAAYENNAAAYEELQQYNQMYAMYGMTQYITEAYYKPTGYRLVTHILLEADEALLAEYSNKQAIYEEQQLTLEEGGEITDTVVTAEDVENARLAILANVQPKVDEINQKLADGATFAELIPQYTMDPGMSDEASIAAGYEVHMDSINWVIPFRDAAFTVDNIGDVTAPVVTDYGVHILQYVADVPGGPVELTDAMRLSFKEALLATAKEDAYYTALDQWVAEANIVYSNEAKVIMGITETTETTEAAE